MSSNRLVGSTPYSSVKFLTFKGTTGTPYGVLRTCILPQYVWQGVNCLGRIDSRSNDIIAHLQERKERP